MDYKWYKFPIVCAIVNRFLFTLGKTRKFEYWIQIPELLKIWTEEEWEVEVKNMNYPTYHEGRARWYGRESDVVVIKYILLKNNIYEMDNKWIATYGIDNRWITTFVHILICPADLLWGSCEHWIVVSKLLVSVWQMHLLLCWPIASLPTSSVLWVPHENVAGPCQWWSLTLSSHCRACRP